MKDTLLLAVRKFLIARFSEGKPLLLGYSGGPDSKALLYLLLECRRFFPIDVHLAHVDHGWRGESAQEALILQKEAEALGVPLHLKTLCPNDFLPKNLEEQGREHRLAFFAALYHELGCQAVVLGHHADDQAEVMLKRVFEGASLFSLRGLTEENTLNGMHLWRPMLSVKKNAVLQWLEERHLSFFQDPTNDSPLNLRGRMRGEIFPFLKEAFGKEVAPNLCRLGEESQEVREYFSSLNRPLLELLKQEPNGFSLALRAFLPLAQLQLKFLLKECFEKQGVILPRQHIEGSAEALLEKKEKKVFITGGGQLCVEQGCLYFINSRFMN